MNDVRDVWEDWSLSQLATVQKHPKMQQLKECVDVWTDETQTRFFKLKSFSQSGFLSVLRNPSAIPSPINWFCADWGWGETSTQLRINHISQEQVGLG